MIVTFLTVFDAVMDFFTLGYWSRVQGDKLVADHWTGDESR